MTFSAVADGAFLHFFKMAPDLRNANYRVLERSGFAFAIRHAELHSVGLPLLKVFDILRIKRRVLSAGIQLGRYLQSTGKH